jgi:drug/metabolite transporter (DMT)-like permease
MVEVMLPTARTAPPPLPISRPRAGRLLAARAVGRRLPAAAILVVAVVWGASFVVVKGAVGALPPADLVAWRFGIAAITVACLAPRALRGMTAATLRRGAVLGLLLGSGFLLQTWGLMSTPAAVSGFLVGSFVVVAPIVGWIWLRKALHRRTVLAVGLAAVGLGLITLRGFAVGSGELVTLLAAVAWAVHMVGLERWSVPGRSVQLAVVQLVVVAVLGVLVAQFDDRPGTVAGLVVPVDASTWRAVAGLGVIATGAAFLIITWAQARLDATRAAILLTAEPVFAGVFGVMVAGEVLTPAMLAGVLCVLAATVVAESGPRADPASRVVRGPRVEPVGATR